MGIVSSAISSLNVLSYKFRSLYNINDGDDNKNNDGNESDGSSITSIDPNENRDFQSPPKSAKRNSVTSNTNFSNLPGSPYSQFNRNEQQQSISPTRRESITGGSNRRGSLASAVYKPPQILANYKNLSDLRKQLKNKYGSDVLISAFSVTLGGFDRKIFIRPILLPILQTTKDESH